MSFNDIESVPLADEQFFCHSPIVKEEIEKFRDNFERNERYKEFDGLIRRNHRIYEANDILPHVRANNLSLLLTSLKDLEAKVKELTKPQFTQNELKRVDLLNLTQMDVLRLAESKLQKGKKLPALSAIEESEKA